MKPVVGQSKARAEWEALEMITGNQLHDSLKLGVAAVFVIIGIAFTTEFVRGLRRGRFAKSSAVFRDRVESDYASRDTDFSGFLRLAINQILLIAICALAVYGIIHK